MERILTILTVWMVISSLIFPVIWSQFCPQSVGHHPGHGTKNVSGPSPYSSYFLGKLLATRTLGHTWDGVLVFTYLGV